MDQRSRHNGFFYDEIIKQASVWVPEIKKDDYNSVMQGKYNNRTRSKIL